MEQARQKYFHDKYYHVFSFDNIKLDQTYEEFLGYQPLPEIVIPDEIYEDEKVNDGETDHGTPVSHYTFEHIKA